MKRIISSEGPRSNSKSRKTFPDDTYESKKRRSLILCPKSILAGEKHKNTLSGRIGIHTSNWSRNVYLPTITALLIVLKRRQKYQNDLSATLKASHKKTVSDEKIIYRYSNPASKNSSGSCIKALEL